MNITEFLSIGIVGVALSLFIDILKAHVGGLKSTKTKLLLVTLSLIIAGAFYFLQSSPYFEAVLTILGFASMTYAFIFKK